MSQVKLNKSTAEVEFTSGKIMTLFLKYGIPSAISLLLVGIQTVVDGYFVGNYAGESAFAGVSIAMPVYVFISALIVVVGIGCQTLIGMNMGKGDYQKANDSFKSGFVALLAITIAISIIILIFTPYVVSFLGADEVLFNHSVSYLKSLTPFFPLLSLLFLGDYKLKATGYPYKGLIILSLCVLVNVILDYIFIAQMGLGTKGAGLATGISFSIGAILILPYIFGKKERIAFQKGHFRWGLVGKILYNGSSEGMAELSSAITVLLFNLSMMKYAGAEGVAAFTAISYVTYVAVTLFVGMSDGIVPVISYNYGALRIKRAVKLLRTNMLINLTIGILFFALIMWGGRWIIAIFFDNAEQNSKAMELAITGSKICAFTFLFNGFNISVSSFFTALGDAKSSIIVSILRGLIFIVLGIALLPLIMGTNGIWTTIPLAELMTFVVAIILLRNRISAHNLAKSIRK